MAAPAGKTPDTQEEFTTQGGDPAPAGKAEFLAVVDGVANIELMAINAGHQLMHSKYVVVDAFTEHGTIWMGSANFTDDSWTMQENNVLTLKSPDRAGFYANAVWRCFPREQPGKAD